MMKAEVIAIYIINLTSKTQCTLQTMSFRICIGKRQKMYIVGYTNKSDRQQTGD